MRYLLLWLSVAMLSLIGAAATRIPASDKIECPHSRTRLYALIGGPFVKNHVNVYCGNDAKPIYSLSEGVRGLLGSISSDDRGYVYVTDSTQEGVNRQNALIIYSASGQLIARIEGLENSAGTFVDRNSGFVYALTPHYEDYSPTRWKNATGWIPGLTVIAGNPPRIKRRLNPPKDVASRFYVVDEPGFILFWDNNNGRIDKMDNSTGKIVQSVWAPADAIAVGHGHILYANGYGTIRVIDTRRLKILRSFHDGSRGPQDDGPIAVAHDGTLFVAHKESATIEEFLPNSTSAVRVIRKVANVSDMIIDAGGTLFAVCRGAGVGQSSIISGVYAFPRTRIESPLMFTDNAGRTLGAVEGITIVTANSTFPH